MPDLAHQQCTSDSARQDGRCAIASGGADPRWAWVSASRTAGHPWRVTHATGCYLDARIGDPCPPSEFLTPEQQAIGQPFADLSRADLPDDQRVADIERGAEIRDLILTETHRFAYALGGSLTILTVRHRPGEPRALVWYTEGSVQPGVAVLDGDHWTVSRATWCTLTTDFGGDPCPA